MSGLVFLGGWLSLFWMSVVWWMTLDKPTNATTTAYIAMASLFAVVLNSPGIWIALGLGYEGDSFATLSFFGKAGVIFISTAGLALIYALIAAKTRRILQDQPTRAVLALLDCIISLAIFGVIYAVSPQVFYTFYQLIFDNLPQQIVLRWSETQELFLNAIALHPTGSLASHLAGIGWLGVIPFTLWFHARSVQGAGPHVLLLALSWLWLQIANIL